MPLTDLICRTAKPLDKRYKLSDREGLYLEVLPSNTKCWRLKYRFKGQERLVTLGNYPQLPLLAARKHREAIKDQIALGIDPVLAKLERLQQEGYVDSPSFRVVAEEWYKGTSDVFPVDGHERLVQ